MGELYLQTVAFKKAAPIEFNPGSVEDWKEQAVLRIVQKWRYGYQCYKSNGKLLATDGARLLIVSWDSEIEAIHDEWLDVSDIGSFPTKKSPLTLAEEFTPVDVREISLHELWKWSESAEKVVDDDCWLLEGEPPRITTCEDRGFIIPGYLIDRVLLFQALDLVPEPKSGRVRVEFASTDRRPVRFSGDDWELYLMPCVINEFSGKNTGPIDQKHWTIVEKGGNQ